MAPLKTSVGGLSTAQTEFQTSHGTMVALKGRFDTELAVATTVMQSETGRAFTLAGSNWAQTASKILVHLTTIAERIGTSRNGYIATDQEGVSLVTSAGAAVASRPF